MTPWSHSVYFYRVKYSQTTEVEILKSFIVLVREYSSRIFEWTFFLHLCLFKQSIVSDLLDENGGASFWYMAGHALVSSRRAVAAGARSKLARCRSIDKGIKLVKEVHSNWTYYRICARSPTLVSWTVLQVSIHLRNVAVYTFLILHIVLISVFVVVIFILSWYCILYWYLFLLLFSIILRWSCRIFFSCLCVFVWYIICKFYLCLYVHYCMSCE